MARAAVLVTGWPSVALRDFARGLAERAPSGLEVSVLAPGVEPRVAAAERLAGGDAANAATTRLEVVCVLDAAQLERDLGSWELLADRGFHANASDHRHVADLLLEQIEAATEIVVLGAVAEATRHGDLLRCLAPRASLRFTGSVEAAIEACAHGWTSPTNGQTQALPETAWSSALRDPASCAVGAHGCHVFRSRRPFHSERFARWFDDLGHWCVRAKGRLWLASRPDEAIGLSRAGAVTRLFLLGRWWACVPSDFWPRCAHARRSIVAKWDSRFGDREQRIAFVGPALDPARITAGLEQCLLTDRELAAGPAAWRGHPDPLAPRRAAIAPWSITHLS